jgi:hypothetical protein
VWTKLDKIVDIMKNASEFEALRTILSQIRSEALAKRIAEANEKSKEEAA